MTRTRTPRISIITPSLHQGEFIGENIKSVAAQNYPNLEHIIIDGGSTDETLDILEDYNHLTVVSEPDEGHANALNKGFSLATGQILAFLNADDTLQPGALNLVSEHIDPSRGVHVVMGRCRFIDADSKYTGIEHPSYFEGRRRMLAIWEGHGIPQPSVFWTREVWETCGPVDETLPYAWIDYDFFCRVSSRYSFHTIDHVISNYRLHATSRTTEVDEATRLEESIAISQKHWGPVWSPTRWRLQMSLWALRVDRRRRGRSYLRRAREAWKQRRLIACLANAILGGILAPDVTIRAVLYPPFRDRVLSRMASKLNSASRRSMPLDPKTSALLDYSRVWDDGWVGPSLRKTVPVGPNDDRLLIIGWTDVITLGGPLTLRIQVGNEPEQSKTLSEIGSFELAIDFENVHGHPELELKVSSDRFFVPDRVHHSGDLRPLSWKLEAIEIR